MTAIHPKVGVPTLVGLGLAFVLAAVQQYVPGPYVPNPATIAALTALVMGLTGYYTPSVGA